jgi:hypothetical protein
MSIQPDGEDLRNAIRWISEMRQDEPQKTSRELIDAACVKFDLSPLDADHLARYLNTEDK